MSIKRPASILILVALLAACGGGREAVPAETYRVRGVVRQLPPADRPGEMQVRHEAIPEFKDADGEVVGMESMTMPFPVADPALVGGIEVGDKIELELEVRWDAGHPLSVTTIEKLPPETRLDFEEEARPSSVAPEASPPSAAAPEADPNAENHPP